MRLLRSFSLLGILATTSVWATDASAVIARVALPAGTGGAVTQLTRHDVEGKRYLYMHRPSERSITILDVTHEDRPSVINTVTHDRLKATGGLHLLPNGTVLVVHQEGAQAAQTSNGASLALWKPTSDAGPQHLADVHAYLVESRRGLLYLADEKGLSIVRVHESQERIEAQRWYETLAP